MEEKKLPKQEIVSTSKTKKIIKIFLVYLRLILGLVLIPFVYSSGEAFLKQFFKLENNLRIGFFGGIIVFLGIYLFVWEPAIVYRKGQRLVQIIFSFFSPLVRIAPYLLPIYTIILFLFYFLFLLIFNSKQILMIFMFLFGLSIILHLVFSARSLREKGSDYLKANYIFGFSLIWLVNIFILAFGFNLIFKDFSFVDFFNQTFQTGWNILNIIFKQLFLLV